LQQIRRGEQFARLVSFEVNAPIYANLLPNENVSGPWTRRLTTAAALQSSRQQASY
jgi:hypothetical protein